MNHTRRIFPKCLLLLAIGSTASSCRSKPPPPEPEVAAATPANTIPAAAPINSADTASSAAATPPAASSGSANPAPQGASADADPLGGKFSLEDAVKGLPKAGKLYADLVTDAGTLKCELYEDKAPNAVANFVGLARGNRPFKDPKTGVWGKRPAYDDGMFHRIIKGFMIQGGDPLGTGQGEAGYVFPDEVWPGATHDRRGLLCMANRGKNTNSMQFFVMDGAAKHLDGGYTIFGSCGPDAIIEKLADTPVRGDRAVSPPKIKKVTIKRGK